MNRASQFTSAFAGHQAVVRASSKARAQGAASALQARFAAVMGSATDKVLDPSQSQAWNIREQIEGMETLQSRIANLIADGSDRDEINALITKGPRPVPEIQWGLAVVSANGRYGIEFPELCGTPNSVDAILSECRRIMHESIDDASDPSLSLSLPSEVMEGPDISVDKIRNVDI